MKRAALLAMLLLLSALAAPAGETIRVLLHVHPWSDGVKTLIPEFEKETGIKVDYEIFGEDQLNQKIMVEFTASGGKELDVFVTRPMQEMRMFVKNGWYEDLTPYVKGDAEYDFADFTPGSIQGTSLNGFQACIPLATEVELLFYRKDILAAKGLTPPKTFAQLEEMAAALTDRAGGFYGFVARGQRSPLITQFSSYLYGFGGDFLDYGANKSLVNTPIFKEAANFYGGMLRKYGPEGAANMHWMQASAVFTQGKAALYTEASSLYPVLMDPSKSPLADKTGVTVFPAGPKAHKTYDVTACGVAISSGSTHKAAAWKFIRYMTDKKRTLITQGKFMNTLARRSTYLEPEGVAKFPPDLVTALAESGGIGVGRDRPMVTAVGEARDTIGDVVVAAITGGDVEAAAKKADQKFQEILDREKSGK